MAENEKQEDERQEKDPKELLDSIMSTLADAAEALMGQGYENTSAIIEYGKVLSDLKEASLDLWDGDRDNIFFIVYHSLLGAYESFLIFIVTDESRLTAAAKMEILNELRVFNDDNVVTVTDEDVQAANG